MVPKRLLGRRFLTFARFVDEISSPYGRPQASLPNNELSGMYATVRPRSYLCRTQNIALQVPISQLNAQRNMESLTASFISWIVEPSSALKILYRNWRQRNR